RARRQCVPDEPGVLRHDRPAAARWRAPDLLEGDFGTRPAHAARAGFSRTSRALATYNRRAFGRPVPAMRMTRSEFLAWPHKAITLLGMSGVGKTTLAYKLPSDQWFHYSGDYRIGTKYLAEPILDNIKRQAMKVDFLRDLLRNDSIYISSNITVHNLQPVAT